MTPGSWIGHWRGPTGGEKKEEEESPFEIGPAGGPGCPRTARDERSRVDREKGSVGREDPGVGRALGLRSSAPFGPSKEPCALGWPGVPVSQCWSRSCPEDEGREAGVGPRSSAGPDLTVSPESART